MTPEQERWAEALQVIKMKGADAATFIGERINALTADGDVPGVTRWREIEMRVIAIVEADQHRQ